MAVAVLADEVSKVVEAAFPVCSWMMSLKVAELAFPTLTVFAPTMELNAVHASKSSPSVRIFIALLLVQVFPAVSVTEVTLFIAGRPQKAKRERILPATLLVV